MFILASVATPMSDRVTSRRSASPERLPLASVSVPWSMWTAFIQSVDSTGAGWPASVAVAASSWVGTGSSEAALIAAASWTLGEGNTVGSCSTSRSTQRCANWRAAVLTCA
ncbi:hypothetical protein G6F62_014875 [Rhizopus arrhizus]|nr:hypothetical protein G6F62_014875 [Rhizopus arrhizus]